MFCCIEPRSVCHVIVGWECLVYLPRAVGRQPDLPARLIARRTYYKLPTHATASSTVTTQWVYYDTICSTYSCWLLKAPCPLRSRLEKTAVFFDELVAHCGEGEDREIRAAAKLLLVAVPSSKSIAARAGSISRISILTCSNMTRRNPSAS